MTDKTEITPEIEDEAATGPNTVKISPAKGRRVRHETGQLLEPKTAVERSPYWQRRSDDGDITGYQPAEKKD